MRLIDADALEREGWVLNRTYEYDANTMVNETKCLSEVQTIEPERKTGHWVEMGQNDDGTHNLCCGVCGQFKFKSRGHANSFYTKERYKFCGGCGAKMGVKG